MARRSLASGPATYVIAATVACGALVLAVVPLPARPATVGKPTTPSLTGGVRAILADRVLRTVTVASSLGQLGPGALAVVAAVLATAQGRPAATGWLLTSVAVGGLFGSLWWTWRPAAPAHAARTVMFALIGVGAALALAAATTSSLVPPLRCSPSQVCSWAPSPEPYSPPGRPTLPKRCGPTFTISAGLKTTTAAAGAALGGSIAHPPPSAQLLLLASSPFLAGALGILALATARQKQKQTAAP